jgi:hypothetical protein
MLTAPSTSQIPRIFVVFLAVSGVAGCDRLFPESVGHAIAFCRFEAQKSIATSPHLGEARDTILGQIGEACMRAKGLSPIFAKATECTHTSSPQVTDKTWGYVPLWDGCWER